jgi:hypothetical protein
MRPLLLLFIFLFIWAKFSIAQKDSIRTIQFVRIKSNGDTIKKKVVPWKVFCIYTFTNHEIKKHTALALDYAGDSSMVITTKAIHPKHYIYVKDTILYKDIYWVKARTKYYNLRRGLGLTSLFAGTIGLAESFVIVIVISPLAGLATLAISTAAIICSIDLIRMRKFVTRYKWKIQAGYLIK